eukprot:6183635-Pleurochrysis_carterae.AAC.1
MPTASYSAKLQFANTSAMLLRCFHLRLSSTSRDKAVNESVIFGCGARFWTDSGQQLRNVTSQCAEIYNVLLLKEILCFFEHYMSQQAQFRCWPTRSAAKPYVDGYEHTSCAVASC